MYSLTSSFVIESSIVDVARLSGAYKGNNSFVKRKCAGILSSNKYLPNGKVSLVSSVSAATRSNLSSTSVIFPLHF